MSETPREYTIYRLACKTPECPSKYIGSTKSFSTRKSTHKRNCGAGLNYRIYETIRANGGWDNWEMSPIEVITCLKREALKREQYWITHHNADLNMVRANLTDEEYAQYQRAYYIDHKQAMIERAMKYYDDNKDKCLAYQAQYRAENADNIKEYMKEYRKENKDKLRDYMRGYMKAYNAKKRQEKAQV
jgi:hypothetical protein